MILDREKGVRQEIPFNRKPSVTPVFTRKKGILNLVLNKMEGSKDEHRKRAGGAPGSDV